MPDLAELHVELRRPGVTLQLLHLEYLERQPAGIGTRVLRRYREWARRARRCARSTSRARRCSWTTRGRSRTTSSRRRARSSRSSCSSRCWARQTTRTRRRRGRRVGDFTASNARAFAFFGGVTKALVPDQLKSAVHRVPVRARIQRTYEEIGRHYGTVVLPARPGLRGTRRRWRSQYKSRSAGSSRGCGTRHSIAGRAERANRRAARGPQRREMRITGRAGWSSSSDSTSPR